MQQRIRCQLAFVGICLFWGTSNLVTKIGVDGLSPTVFASIRYLTAGLIMLVLAHIRGQSLPHDKKLLGKLLFIGSIMHFGTNGCVVLSNKMIDSGVVTILLATVPIFVALIQTFILRTQKLYLTGKLGLAGGFCGILLVAAGNGDQKASALGIGLGLFGAFLWAIGSMMSSGLNLQKDILAVTSMQMLFAAVLFVITGLFTHTYELPPTDLHVLWPAFYMAIVDSTLGFLLYSWLLQVWDPVKTATYAYINPVVALVLGAVFLHETITPAKITGMVLIIISVFLIQRKSTKKERRS